MPRIVLFNTIAWKHITEPVLPLSLLRIAAPLINEYEIKIIDQQFDRNWKFTLKEELKKNPLCVGISCMTGRQIESALEASELVKKHSKATIVWGGKQASQAPEVTIRHPLVDIIAIGEADISFYELVQALAQGRSLENIKGIWYKTNGTIHRNSAGPLVNLDELPPLPYQLVDVGNYIGYGGDSRMRAIDIITSSGCPYHCTYCYNTAFNKGRWRSYSAEKVLEDIKWLNKEHGIQHFRILDDNFFADLKRSRKIAEGLMKTQKDLSWQVMGAHINSLYKMDKDYLQILDESQLKIIAVGIESGSPEILKKTKKGFTDIEKVLHVNRMLAQTQIIPVYAFMSGLPYETDSDLKATIDLMFRLKEDNPNIMYGLIHPFVPYPGTELYQYAIDHGFQVPHKLEDWATYSWDKYTQIELPWLSKKKRKMLQYLYFTTVLLNPNYLFINQKWFSFLAQLFLPITKYRIRKLNFHFPIEQKAIQLYKKYLS